MKTTTLATTLVASLVVGLAAPGAAEAAGHTLSNARLAVTFGDTDVWAAPDADRVDAIAWTDSLGNARTNFVSNGGPQHCGDPQEFFGESYGEPEGTSPLLVFGGVVDTWKGTATTKGSTHTQLKGYCDTAPDAVTKTAYLVAAKASMVNEIRVTRSFMFNASTPAFTAHGLRAYVPRLPLSVYPQVLVPNAAGTIATFGAYSCSGDCEITDWNGRWFADDDGAGNGMMVIRSASSTTPALVAINNDGYSASNLTSVVLLQPAGGWKSTVTETEYLCFYDATSWTSAMRAAGKLPKGCAGTLP
jgi:hypothetical protein